MNPKEFVYNTAYSIPTSHSRSVPLKSGFQLSMRLVFVFKVVCPPPPLPFPCDHITSGLNLSGLTAD